MSNSTKVWLIIAISLILIGCILFVGVMTMLEWDFNKLSMRKYETNRYEISDDYKNVSISAKTADVVFAPSKSGKTEVVCYEQTNCKHSVTVKDETLEIEVVDTRKWYERIWFDFERPKITVYLPEDEYGVIFAKTTTGDISIANVSSTALELSVTTGDVDVRGINCSGNVEIKVTTGDASIVNCRCKNLVSNGITGDIALKNVIAVGRFEIKRTTGDIEFEKCDAAELVIKATTGDVSGLLLSGKKFNANATTGRVRVPSDSGEGTCKINVTTGNITVEIE